MGAAKEAMMRDQEKAADRSARAKERRPQNQQTAVVWTKEDVQAREAARAKATTESA